MNTPNKLTIFRMVLAPFFLLTLMLGFNHHFLVAELIFVVASVTDFIDGKLARSRNQITTLGKLLDPIADKMLVTAALLGLMMMGQCNIWICFVILLREYVVTGVRMIALTHEIVIPANIWGKIKTASQMVSVVIILALNELTVMGYSLFAPVSLISNVLLGFTAVMAALSGILYIVKSAKQINFFENK